MKTTRRLLALLLPSGWHFRRPPEYLLASARVVLASLLFGILVSLVLLAPASRAERYEWRNYFADDGGRGWVDGSGSAARFGSLDGIAVDPAGNVYVADTGNMAIRKVTPDGVVSTVGGRLKNIGAVANLASGADGLLYARDTSTGAITRISATGEATAFAAFPSPFVFGIAIDATGNVYAAVGDHVIRKVTPLGEVTILAGSPYQFGNVDGSGSVARFASPSGLAFDSHGNLYVTGGAYYPDGLNASPETAIRKVTPSGNVTTLFRSGFGDSRRFPAAAAIAVDGDDNVFLADTDRHLILKITAAGNVSTFAGTGAAGEADGPGGAARFRSPTALAVGRDGNLIVADSLNHTIRKINPAGEVSTLAGKAFSRTDVSNPFDPADVEVDASGNLYISDTDAVRKITPDGSISKYVTGTHTNIALDAGGNVYSFTYNGIYWTTPSDVTTFFSGSASYAGFEYPPSEGAFDAKGNLYVVNVADQIGLFRRIAPDGTGKQLPYGRYLNGRSGIAVDPQGYFYVGDVVFHHIPKFTPTGTDTRFVGRFVYDSEGNPVGGFSDGIWSVARFNGITGLGLDSQGNLYVADAGNHLIRKVTKDRKVKTIGGLVGQVGYADGIGSSARFTDPTKIAVGPNGSVYVIDSGLVVGTPLPPMPPAITSALTATALQGQSFTYPIAATNGPTSYKATGLPRGLSLNAISGLIGGIPAVAGFFKIPLSATNDDGSDAAELSLTVSSPLVSAVADGVTASDATLHGTMNPNSSGAGAWFEFGVSSRYGSKTATTNLGSNIAAVNFSAAITRLLPHTTYHYRAVAKAGSIVFQGQDKTFTTSNTLPVALDDWLFTSSVRPSGLVVLGNDKDTDRDKLSIVNVDSASNGSVLLTRGSLLYTPGAAFAGMDSFSYTVTDGFGGQSTARVYLANPGFDGLLALGGIDMGYLRLAVGARAAFTGTVNLGGVTVQIRGAFDNSGHFLGSFPRPGLSALTVTLDLDISTAQVSADLFDGAAHYTGTLLNAVSIATPDLARRYTALIAPAADTALPQGIGYGVMNVTPTGAVTIAGKLCDGTSYTAGGLLHADRTWALFAPLSYSKTASGIVAGKIAFGAQVESDCSGALHWVKPATGGAYFPGSIDTTARFRAAVFTPPARGQRVLNFTDPTLGAATFNLTGGNVAASITHSLAVSSSNGVKVTDPGADKLAVVITPSNGLVTGSFIAPATQKVRPSISGVIYQKQNYGAAGVFTGVDAAGSFKLTAQ